jgi:hypothetical protein
MGVKAPPSSYPREKMKVCRHEIVFVVICTALRSM